MALGVDFYEHEIDVADNFASKAVDRMRVDKIPPVPQNFEVWYVYYANANPRLRNEVNELLLKQDKITEEHCQDLYEKYINNGHNRETYERAGNKIQMALQDVYGLMDNMKTNTNDFTTHLKDANSKMDVNADPESIKNVLESIVKETSRMISYNTELETRLSQSSVAMSDIKRDMELIRREAITDGLTGLANRKSFDEQMKRITEKSHKTGDIYSLIMIDIDHFKAFNDTYGHQVGDQVLRLVALTLVSGVKGQDMAARYGGEEFAIILPDTNLNAALSLANNLRKAVEKKEVINRSTGENLGQITVSLGVAQQYGGEEGAESVIGRADKALYASKNKGRNQVSAAPSPHEENQ